jgi:hypothetical protein
MTGAGGCSNVQKTASVTIRVCDLSLDLAVPTADICVNGANATISLSLNAATPVMGNLKVQYTLPTELSFMSAIASTGTYASGVWDLGNGTFSGTYTLTLTVQGTTAGISIPTQAYISEVSGSTYTSYSDAMFKDSDHVNVTNCIYSIPVNPGIKARFTKP